MDKKKGEILIGVMSKEEQKKQLYKHIKNKKFQVDIEIFGKKKFAYCDELSELDELIKSTHAKILKITGLKKC